MENNNNCECAGINLLLLSNAVALVLAKDLNSDQQNVLANFLQAIGQNLSLLAASSDACINNNK